MKQDYTRTETTVMLQRNIRDKLSGVVDEMNDAGTSSPITIDDIINQSLVEWFSRHTLSRKDTEKYGSHFATQEYLNDIDRSCDKCSLDTRSDEFVKVGCRQWARRQPKEKP